MMANQDTTKPSRINRKFKRRWKKPVKIADLVKAGLTDCYRVVNLVPVAHIGGTGLAFSNTRHKAANMRYFFVQLSALHIMSGWVGTRKSGRVVCPVRQPTQSGTMIGVMLSGLNPFTHEVTA